jgi:RNA polymerase primary sigma factor
MTSLGKSEERNLAMAQVLEMNRPRARKAGKSAGRKEQSVGNRPTFDSPELEGSFVHYCQLVAPELESEESLARTVKGLLATELEFIGSLDFAVAGAAAVYFQDGFLIPSERAGLEKSKVPELPPHLARLCEAKLLTADEERLVFHRMNFLKFKANQLRQQLSVDAPCSWTIRRIQALLTAADWYRDRMIKSNMRLVISIVKKFVNKQNGFDDLLSDGIVALLRAVDKFDVGLGFRFSTYATQVVRRNTYRRVMEKQKERQRITLSIHESGVDVSDEHRSPSMSEERWQALRSRLGLMLDKLDRREKLIVRARFSLGGHRRVQTLQRLADKLGVSKERVRQLEKRALEKLRDLALESPLPDTESFA